MLLMGCFSGLFAQNVGINLANPTARLHVYEPVSGVVANQVDKDGQGDGLHINLTNTLGGLGNAIEIIHNSNTTASSAFWLRAYGGFAGLNVDNYGSGMGAQIWNHHPTSTKSALTVHNESMGKALYVDATGGSSDTMMYAINYSTSLGSYLYSNGSGMQIYANDGNAALSISDNEHAIYGYSNDALAVSRGGVYGRSTGLAGIVGSAGAGSTFAIYGYGDIGGASKSFYIDHPLDPQNKILKHFSIESDEPMLIYRGTVSFDANGEAFVQLKDYVHAINKNYTYNLTPIGQYMPIYIGEEVNENGRFKIAGGVAGQKVAWTVYGERDDAYFQSKPEKLVVEIDKSANMQGKYLYPSAYDLPPSSGYDYDPLSDNIVGYKKRIESKPSVPSKLIEK